MKIGDWPEIRGGKWRAFNNMPNITRIIFVRHARAQYGEDDRIRPLTEDGLKNRKIVVEALKDYKIDCFMSSPYKRNNTNIKVSAMLTLFDRGRFECQK